jgi:hypothetical protein
VRPKAQPGLKMPTSRRGFFLNQKLAIFQPQKFARMELFKP